MAQTPATGQCKWSLHAKVNAIHTKVNMPLFLHPLNNGTGKCDVQKCPFAAVAADAHACGIDECTKKVHVECCTRPVVAQQRKESLPPLPDKCLACAKKHHCPVVELAKPVEVHRWSNNAKLETLLVTGEWILVDWLTKEDNCIKCKGEDNGGHAKKHCCLIMASKCTQLTLCERTHKTVLTKVSAMEDQWRNTHDWVNNTGQGVLRDDGKEVVDNLAAMRCFFCCDSEPIMIDRAGTNPLVTGENSDDSDDNDVDDDDDVGSESSSIPKTITQQTTEKMANDDSAKKMTVAEKKDADKKKRASCSGDSLAGSVSVIDVETKEMFANAKSSSANRLKQTAVHHWDLLAHQREMKALEERKVVLQENAANAINWSEKMADATHKCELHLKCKSMSEDGWPDDMIPELMPELAAVIKSKSTKVKRPSESPAKPAAKSRNDNDDSPAKRTQSKNP